KIGTLYLVQFDCNLEANDLTNITGNQKRAIFLSNCGREVFKTACTIIAPDHLQMVPRHAFYRRDQAEGESISCYMSALCNSALYCEFRNLDKALRDRLVSGVRDIRLQRCLLARATLTLKEALDEAVAAEQSGRSTEEIQTQKSNSRKTARQAATVHREETEDMEVRTQVTVRKTCTKRERQPPQGMTEMGNIRQHSAWGAGETTRGQHANIKTFCRRCRKKGHLAHVCHAAFPEATPTNTEKGSSSCPHSRKRSQRPTTRGNSKPPIREPSKQENTRDC
ncbi:hypothetical protein E2320_022698, partial [Naja naja]